MGLTFFTILDGPSNGMELLTFDEALQLEREDGSATLERSDCVIMDNCGFHHAGCVEPILRNMFADCGISLPTPLISILVNSASDKYRTICVTINYLKNMKPKSQSRKLFNN